MVPAACASGASVLDLTTPASVQARWLASASVRSEVCGGSGGAAAAYTGAPSGTEPHVPHGCTCSVMANGGGMSSAAVGAAAGAAAACRDGAVEAWDRDDSDAGTAGYVDSSDPHEHVLRIACGGGAPPGGAAGTQVGRSSRPWHVAAGGRPLEPAAELIALGACVDASARAARALAGHESVCDDAGDDGMVSDGEGRSRASEGAVPASEALTARCREAMAEELPQRRP